MRDWLHSTNDEINNMSFDEASELVQKQIDLGHTTGDFRPREHLTKAFEIVLAKANSSLNFTNEEIDMLKYSLTYLHDADLSDFGENNIVVLETLMTKLGIDFSPWE